MDLWLRLGCAAAFICAGVACDDKDDGPVNRDGIDAGQAGEAGVLPPGSNPPGNNPPGNNPPGNIPDASLDASRDGALPFNNAFAVRGRLVSAPGDKRVKGPGDAAVEHSVTHVMAVNPATANPVRYLQPVAADGTFAIGVDLATPWVIVLVDSRQSGSDMIAGVFRGSAFDLDSIAATRPGMLDMGDVRVDTMGEASASVRSSDLLTALGLSESAATLLGAMDDISLRYVNPDVDNNGKIDVLEGVSYGLDFHLRYSMVDDSGMITLSSLLGRFADAASTRAVYGLGSAIALWDPSRFGTTSAADYRIRFPTASGSFQAPPRSGTFSADVWIEDDSYFYTSAGTNSVGISFDSTQPFPVGEYDFEVKGTELSFSHVRTHSLDELNRGADLIIPFLKLNAADASCTGWSCAVTGVDYRWMKRTGTGWTLASAEEIALIIPQRGGFMGFSPGGDTMKRLELTIPGTPEGTLMFATPSNNQNVTPAEIAALTVGQICHLGISYDDTLGMRIFQNWQSSPTCPY